MRAGAGLTAPYSAEVEQEAVSTDASVLAMNITGGLPGSSVDGTIVYKVGRTKQPLEHKGCVGPVLQELVMCGH